MLRHLCCYVTCDVTPLVLLHHMCCSATCVVTPLVLLRVLLRHLCCYATCIIKPLALLRHLRRYATCIDALIIKTLFKSCCNFCLILEKLRKTENIYSFCQVVEFHARNSFLAWRYKSLPPPSQGVGGCSIPSHPPKLKDPNTENTARVAMYRCSSPYST